VGHPALRAGVAACSAGQASKLQVNASFEKMIPQSHPYIRNYLDNRRTGRHHLLEAGIDLELRGLQPSSSDTSAQSRMTHARWLKTTRSSSGLEPRSKSFGSGTSA